MKKHKFVLIGCGRISYKHINAINKIENAKLTAVCDLKEESARGKGEENNITWYTDYHKMLKHEDIDIVNILVESGKHAEVFKDIIHYKKHIIIEKPMALTLSDADDIRETPSMVIIEELYQKGAKIKAFDPQAMEEAKKKLKDLKGIIFCRDEYKAIEGADALVIITEWNQSRRLDFARI